MVYQLFPTTEPLAIPGGARGPLFQFFVPVGAEETFLRVVALWHDNTPLVGDAPTFQLKSGRDSQITTVNADGASVHIAGGKEDTVARARCQRQSADTYLISISDIAEDAGPWHLRIANNESETLRFTWVSSDKEANTLQPWMALEVPEDRDGDGGLSLVADAPDTQVIVRNLGTVPLILYDRPGVQLGGGDSPAFLVSHPGQIDTYGVGRITIRCGATSYRDEYEHVFDTNDTNAAHSTLRFQTIPAHGGPGYVPPDPAPFCRRCARCPGYLPPVAPAIAGGPCQRDRCGHPASAHFALPPDRRNR